ncbi:glycoside hydrolase family 3 protein [Infundibulicybe gibba]|nr:glycoside hydrolase family 3 protein [Infundibulicybe gibba]
MGPLFLFLLPWPAFAAPSSSQALSATGSSQPASTVTVSAPQVSSSVSFGSTSSIEVSISAQSSFSSAPAISSASFSGLSSAVPSSSAAVSASASSVASSAAASAFSPFPVPSRAPVPGVFPAPTLETHRRCWITLLPDFGPAWADAYAKAKKKVAQFSLEEKVNVSTGVGWEGGRCLGNVPPIHSGGWPGLCLEDSPLGVRNSDFVTGFPAGVNAAATFNRGLMRTRGLFMGREHMGKGVNVALGPMMNMGRVAQGGRNWEGFGADPFLTGEAAYETILGMQAGGVQACAKHLVNNEQEHSRTTSSSDVDDRTQHEIYTHPFLRSVMAGVASMMCSYNQVNDTYACENDKIMDDIVKREFGFQGCTLSPLHCTRTNVSPNRGLDVSDITFNSGTSYFGANLTSFVQNGTIPLARLDDMAVRIVAAWYYLHQDAPSYPPTNFDAFLTDNEATNEHIDVQDDHFELVRTMGAASTVLLKNEGNVLPLTGKNKPRSLAIVGNDAGPGRAGPNQFGDQGGSDGTLAMGWGSGTANFTYLITPLDAIQQRARKDRTSVNWFLDNFDLARAGNVVRFKSAAIVFINSDSGEDYIIVDQNEGDRPLVLAVAAQNNNTIVVAHSVGPLIVEPWIDHPNVTAVLWAGLPGQEAGNSITDVLYGDWNPSGRLPYTIAKQASDYPAQVIVAPNSQIIEIPYTEGLEIDYRHFDAKNITPRFEFGFGLSYTKFEYSNLHISTIASSDHTDAKLEQAWDAGKASPIAEGSSTALWLHRPAFKVTFNVKNVGGVFGGEIPQLYINMPASAGEPPSLLKGFTNIEVAPGSSESAQGWRKPTGKIGVTIGASSRDARLHGAIPS